MSENVSSLLRRFLTASGVTLAILLTLGTPASAHTGFESSSPSEGETVDGPISEISLTFSGEATPAGDGFSVLDPDGTVRVPDEVTSNDNLTWTLAFSEPLAGGEVGVRWSVAAPDAHPIDGSFSFTTSDLALVSAGTAPETTTSPTTAPKADGTTALLESASGSQADVGSGPAPESASAAVELEDFLDATSKEAAGASFIASAARIIRLLGTVGAIGGSVFAAFVLRGNRRDIRAVLDWVRRSGVLLMVGAVAALIAQVAAVGGWSGLWSVSTLSDVVGSSLGFAIALRFLAGALINSGVQLNTHHAAHAPDPVVAAKQLVGVGAGSASGARTVPGSFDTGGGAGTPFVHHGDEAWQTSRSPGAFLGAGLLALSFLFDGHTVSEGPRWLHGFANLVHVVTAATWAGGVVMLAFVIARRRRRGVDTRALQLGVRFSVVAIVALVAAAVAGVALTVVILDSVSEIWTTPWGQLLVLKVLLVSVAAAGGAYNHRVIVPELERAPNDAELATRFRTVVTVEAVALAAVTVVTALLIAASSS